MVSHNVKIRPSTSGIFRWYYRHYISGVCYVKKAGFVAACVFTFILTLSGITTDCMLSNESDQFSRRFLTSEYSTDNPVVITSDLDFETQGWPGNGSVTNPYRIEGLSITDGGTSISISGTSSHFVVQDCIIQSNTSMEDVGIYLDGTSNGTIRNCSIDGKYRGVEVWYSIDYVIDDNSIMNGIYAMEVNYGDFGNITRNEASECYAGVQAHYCEDANISSNVFTNNRGVGVYVGGGEGGAVYNNTIQDSQSGIKSMNMVNTIFEDNSIDCEYGFSIDNSQHITVKDNVISTGFEIRGSEIVHWITNAFEDNIVRGKPVAFLNGTVDAYIDASSYGAVILANCSGIAVADGDFNNSFVGISVAFSKNCEFTDNYAESVWGALIRIERSESCVLRGNAVMRSMNWGFVLYRADHCLVVGNHAEYASDGIYLQTLSNCTIRNNEFQRNYQDIYIDMVDNCTITGNTLYPSHYGIMSMSASFCNITNNYLLGGYSGIFLQGTASCRLVGNEVVSFRDYGISLDADTQDCLLFDNILDRNIGDNALDNGIGNQWDDGMGTGNSWSDYLGNGTYSVPGAAGSIDHFPRILHEDILPYLDHPSDIEYTAGESGYAILWSPSDDFPALYEVLKDGVLFDSGPWDGSEISVSVNGLLPGVYNYTLTVWDLSGNSASDTVFVTVLEESVTTADTTQITTETSSTANTEATISYTNTTTLPSTSPGSQFIPPDEFTIMAVSVVISAGLLIVVVIILRKK